MPALLWNSGPDVPARCACWYSWMLRSISSCSRCTFPSVRRIGPVSGADAPCFSSSFSARSWAAVRADLMRATTDACWARSLPPPNSDLAALPRACFSLGASLARLMSRRIAPQWLQTDEPGAFRVLQ